MASIFANTLWQSLYLIQLSQQRFLLSITLAGRYSSQACCWHKCKVKKMMSMARNLRKSDFLLTFTVQHHYQYTQAQRARTKFFTGTAYVCYNPALKAQNRIRFPLIQMHRKSQNKTEQKNLYANDCYFASYISSWLLII